MRNGMLIYDVVEGKGISEPTMQSSHIAHVILKEKEMPKDLNIHLQHINDFHYFRNSIYFNLSILLNFQLLNFYLLKCIRSIRVHS